VKLYGGIDLHSNNNVIVLLDTQDQIVYQKRVPNDLNHILQQLAPYHNAIQGLVVESTYNWYWLVDGLMEAGYRVHLANTAAIQRYEGLKYTDDRSDARWLGHLLRLGVLPEGYIYPKPSGLYATWPASGLSWCASGPRTCSVSKISSHDRPGRA
jgi:transposase